MAQSESEQVRSMALLLLKPYQVPTTPNIIDAERLFENSYHWALRLFPEVVRLAMQGSRLRNSGSGV